MANELNERLKCIGEDEETGGSIKGAAHRGIISVKDTFTSGNNATEIIEEALRGESQLLEEIDSTFQDLEAIDGETRNAIVNLKENVVRTMSELRNQK
ncbi:DUF2383 domain-containing protein [Pelagicoccus albus]|uniref:DUF2383 domain-containing protein n=1 Tax=Pelagicoccus albus TaxID=415222 RepID=A0A7X1B5B9_9BACT|nr:DUF2383 domain-containing protein [Pelagicoccus albus]MBC2605939.1 DUF2383 domain-containing protein [Pelagicoccus albus]